MWGTVASTNTLPLYPLYGTVVSTNTWTAPNTYCEVLQYVQSLNQMLIQGYLSQGSLWKVTSILTTSHPLILYIWKLAHFIPKLRRNKDKRFQVKPLTKKYNLFNCQNAYELLISLLTNTMVGMKVEAAIGNNPPIKWHRVSESVR